MSFYICEFLYGQRCIRKLPIAGLFTKMSLGANNGDILYKFCEFAKNMVKNFVLYLTHWCRVPLCSRMVELWERSHMFW